MTAADAAGADFERVHLALQLAGQPGVVVVAERDQVVRCLQNAAVACTRKPCCAGVLDDADATSGSGVGECFHRFGAVEDHDDLDGSGILLIGDRRESTLEELEPITRRDHDGHARKRQRPHLAH
ncbi:hypothetical protein L0C25_05590 [Solicola gregarius]|uniref:Uncharacterized protein n=1 Tax=Solicola gregarius TaxID=2908642 RepID=A0AA46TJQ9_9ACTN|nr:hypothetical protein [Solicola gregarius]UYM06546.1 hypothetical protein L0C25_05590 [Solicola gregarius]